MSIKVEDYFAPETFQRMKAFADKQETPFVVIDKQTIADAYDQLTDCFPFARIYYAVKANPATEITELLRDKGSNFDIASIYELDKVMKTGVGPERISYGNTIKKSKDIRYFYEKGVRLFATDSEADLRNIAKAAPGAKVYVRILTEGSTTADWPLSRKFGCQTDMAMDLLILARQLGLEPYGISFHVGSQQRDISVWDAAIAKVKVIFERLKEEDGIVLKMINMGGGFPANYITKTNDLETYAEEIIRFLKEGLRRRPAGNHPRAGPFADRQCRHPGQRSGAGRPQVADRRGALGLCRRRQVLRTDRNHGRVDQVPDLDREAGRDGRGGDRRPDLRQRRHHVRALQVWPAAEPGERRPPLLAVYRRLHHQLQCGGVQRLPAAEGVLPLAQSPLLRRAPPRRGFFMSLWKPRGARVSLVRQPMTRTPT
ncbi:ornithine decarboxylase [Pseudomonas aeruginosa]|nr:ornithine decarboxylase [Pseudomonas aeruginosa]